MKHLVIVDSYLLFPAGLWGNLAHDDEAAPACSTRRRLFPPRLHPVHAGVQHRGI